MNSDDSIDLEVGRRVQSVRKARGLNQADIADAIGITQSRVSAKEAGRTLAELVGVAERLSVPAGAFLPGGQMPRVERELTGGEAELLALVQKKKGLDAIALVRLGEVVYRGPAPGSSVADDGLLLRAPDGRWLFVEADRCWPVGPAR